MNPLIKILNEANDMLESSNQAMRLQRATIEALQARMLAQTSTTALELMTSYSDGKQWAQENLLSEAAIDAAAAVLADGYWQHATPDSKIIYQKHARAMLEAAIAGGV